MYIYMYIYICIEAYMYIYMYMYMYVYIHSTCCTTLGKTPGMGWLQLVGSIIFFVSFAKEPYKRDNILQK